MNRDDYPQITQYRYLYRGILASQTNAQLTAVGESINATVQPGHTEYTHLVQAGRERWKEIWTKQESESKEVK